MKGVIFNLLEEVVCEQFGDDAWDALLVATGSDGAYASLGSYADAELVGLVEAASKVTGTPVRELLHWFGQLALPKLAERYPVFFEQAPDARSLILSANTIIHPEVRKLYAGASCPHFHFTEEAGSITLGYASARKMCDLAHGFIDGVAAHYGETVSVRQPACMHDGASACQITVTWS